MSLRFAHPGSVLLLSLAVAGCGSSGPRVVKVAGTVTRGGKAVEKLLVNFYPEHGRPSWGVTDKDGRYTLQYEKNQDGAVAGMHKVWVEMRPANRKEEADMRSGALKLHPEMQNILSKYGNSETTPLSVDVSDKNKVIDLKLD